ncbi:related to Oligomycin resistance ATP-dependent permease YOR1 [Hanseniaspora guilliermondii]|uniref:Related to Oligomycin resistance ATP-dependent permease YOR1 n=1 Tax=Hanseniaspora guilliermondii TaxID=56406 RepID=A0A1L0CRL0_9ASCO|nr:related to Oligomycin resistance ATP-dependent permease YOR1 [Hanseniaspora guilliermondii]
MSSSNEQIWLQDLERVSESEYLPQKRLFTKFLPKELPAIPEAEAERKFIPPHFLSPLNFFFFHWVLPIIKAGYRRTVQPNDLFKVNSNQEIGKLHQDFERNWELALAKVEANGKLPGKTFIIKVLFKTFKWSYSLSILFSILSNAGVACVPFVSKKLIAFVEEKHFLKSHLSPGKGIGYTFGLAGLLYMYTTFNSHMLANSFIVGGFCRSILQKAILIKSFKVSNKSKSKFTQAIIASMSTTDLNRIEMGVAFHTGIYAFPVSIGIALGQLLKNIGPISLIGCFYFLVAIAVNLFAFKYIFTYRISANKRTDVRIGLIREIANSLKIIKFYAWENAYYKNISERRREEISRLGKMQIMFSSIISFDVLTPTVASMIVFASLYGINGGLKSPANTFSSLAVFQVLLSVVFMIPQTLSSSMTAYVALKRIQEFLLSEEDESELRVSLPCNNVENSVEVEGCSFEWSEVQESPESENDEDENNDTAETTVKSNFKGLQDLNFDVKKGEFIVVTGPIGCGKSSLLYALANLMKKTEGELRINGELLLNGEPWIQNTTFRNNITFGTKFIQEKYDTVIDVCALKGDLDLLDAGHNTEIGERGVTLSGGQKQRLALARTVYKDADIYLFDDVLSAVDAHVGKHIMDNCILDYLHGKTRILATHQLNLIEHADRVLFLGSDYTYAMGTLDELLATKPDFKVLMDNFTTKGISKTIPVLKSKKSPTLDESVKNNDEKDIFNTFEVSSGTDSTLDEEELKLEKEREERKKGRIIAKEQRAVNSIGWNVYKTYAIFGSGKKIWPLAVSIAAFSQTLNTFCTLFTTVWLSYWSEKKFKNRSDGFYIGIYALFAFGSMITTFLAAIITFTFGLNASKKLHNQAAYKILHVPMSYIDTTPVGSIINRFSKDIDILDNELPMNLDFLLAQLFEIGGILIMAIIYLPWFAIATPFLFILLIVILDIYQSTAREVKRLESVQRSFVVNNFQESMSGLNTIKMFKMQEMFVFKNDYTINKQNEATIAFQSLQRWASNNVMLLAVTTTILICIMCSCGVFSINAAATGVLINYIIQLTTSLRMLLLQSTELENFMNSTERVNNYATELEQESAYDVPETDPGSDWPNLNPSISFENVSMRYRKNLPLILKNLNFEIKAGEKIGICGKTGCGKSSTVSTLFRITEIEEGTIKIGGVDISKLGLYNLRKKISIIPQESVLFKTDIRKNLDPFGDYSDEQLWKALVDSGAIEESELEAVKKQKFPEDRETAHKFHLDRQVEEDGKNFSLGERQLLGLSRAVVRNSKVLVLDEATSSVDYETDAKIQRKIKENFGKDTTILTIAHRLKTIIDYDRVLVLDAGEIKEFDAPYKLFSNPDSVFRGLCDKAKIKDEDFKSIRKD